MRYYTTNEKNNFEAFIIVELYLLIQIYDSLKSNYIKRAFNNIKECIWIFRF